MRLCLLVQNVTLNIPRVCEILKINIKVLDLAKTYQTIVLSNTIVAVLGCRLAPVNTRLVIGQISGERRVS